LLMLSLASIDMLALAGDIAGERGSLISACLLGLGCLISVVGDVDCS
jgi:hypothetical protein